MAEGETEAKAESETFIVPENVDDNAANTNETTPTSGCNPVFINTFTYVSTLIWFIVIIEISNLPTLLYPLNGSMIVSNNDEFANNHLFKKWFIFLWAFHFMRRSLEVLFVHRYKRRMSIIESVGAPIYYWFFAIWIAWSMRIESGYKNTFMVLVLIGSIIFLLGEVGNCICHIQLRRFRAETRSSFISNTSRHVLPHGLLFECISCPHYSCEIVAWIGFFLATWTLPAIVFLLATIITLVVYARKKHNAYLQEFDGSDGSPLYPAHRKALIPCLF